MKQQIAVQSLLGGVVGFGLGFVLIKLLRIKRQSLKIGVPLSLAVTGSIFLRDRTLKQEAAEAEAEANQRGSFGSSGRARVKWKWS